MRNIFLSLLLAALVIGSIYWLWQRQPKPEKTDTQATSFSQNDQDTKVESFTINPKSGIQTQDAKVKLEGVGFKDSYILILSNSKDYVLKTSGDGKFEKEVTLTKGLNLIEVVNVSGDFQDEQKKTLVYWLRDTKEPDSGQTIFVGSVKSILESVLTATFNEEEQTVRITKATTIEFPDEDDKESTRSAISNVRVGDFIIALGNSEDDKNKQSFSSNKIIDAKIVKIVRVDKPRITKKYMLAKILTSPRQNIFSARNKRDDKIAEFKLAKNSEIFVLDTKADSGKVTKDINAFIVYHEDKEENLADFVYLINN